MKKLIIIGAGGHGKVVAEAASLSGKYNDICFLDSNFPILVVNNVVGHSDDYESFISKDAEFIVAVGDCTIRHKISKNLSSHGAELAKIIHPKSYISEAAHVSKGTYIGAFSIINPGASISFNCIINTGAIIEHDCNLQESVHISPGSVLSGNVQVGMKTWIGAGATVINNIKIGSNVIVGAGAVVIRDIPSDRLAMGVPARFN